MREEKEKMRESEALPGWPQLAHVQSIFAPKRKAKACHAPR